MSTTPAPVVENKTKATYKPLRRPWGTYISVTLAVMIVLLAILSAIAPGLIAPDSPNAMNTLNVLKAPSGAHIFGTDQFGRDVFSRVVYGARDSLEVGIASVVVGAVVGGLLGLIAGFVGGWMDMVIMRIIDVLMAFPGILLALTIVSVLGPSIRNVILAVSVSAVPSYARIMRSQVISIRNRPYVHAAEAVGTKSYDILLRHVLPNSVTPLLVVATIGVGTSILVAAGLSFLGFGASSTVPEWGRMLSDGRDYLTMAWWVATFPGLAITILVLAVNLLGDALRDRFDPKSVKR